MENSSAKRDSKKQKVVHQNHLIKMNQQTINVCVFARTSSEGSKEDRQSYTRQLNELQEYCTKRNWTVTKVIASKISGSKDESKRVDIKELNIGSMAHSIGKVVVNKAIAMGKEDVETIEKIKAKGITFNVRKVPTDSNENIDALLKKAKAELANA